MSDQERWDKRYLGRPDHPSEPIAWLQQVAELLPTSGRALDVAGGDGRNALWLARRGLTVTLADVSPVALERAQRFAQREDLSLQTLAIDLSRSPAPPAAWDLILVSHYLDRDLLPRLVEALAPGGLLVVQHFTRSNLQRSAHPSARFLLEDGELPSLLGGAELLRSCEGWVGDQHLARLVVRR